MRHNNAVPKNHFRKKWALNVKTWFHQPIQKKIRREKRQAKAAAIAPIPSSGPLRPVVHCQTQKYNSKVKLGRGFSLDELKAAGISRKWAATVGISVDHRRINKSDESLNANVERLKEYKSRLVVFPRKAGQPKKGDATAEQIASVKQLKGDVLPLSKSNNAVSYVNLTEELKGNKAHYALRDARNNARLVGIRIKKSKQAKTEAAATD